MNLVEFITILGWFYNDNAEELLAKWSRLTDEERDSFMERITEEGFAMFAMWKGDGLFSEDTKARLFDMRCFLQLQTLRNEASLKRLYGELESEGIRFAPIKGIDLSYRFYPSPVMRLFGDWDIWFHPDDFARAKAFLLEHGWREKLTLSDEFHHHGSPLVKSGRTLEPHRTLPCFHGTSPHDLWRHTEPCNGSECRRTLEPELNLLLCARHASENEYRVVSISKLLLDTAFLLSGADVDWQRLKELSKELGQPYPGNLFAAFPEFFGEDFPQKCLAEREKAEAYRRIFEQRDQFKCTRPVEFMMMSRERYSAKWFRKACVVFHQKNMRHKYGLPYSGAYLRLAMAYVAETFSKAFRFLRCLFTRRKGLEEYIHAIKNAEGME